MAQLASVLPGAAGQNLDKLAMQLDPVAYSRLMLRIGLKKLAAQALPVQYEPVLQA